VGCETSKRYFDIACERIAALNRDMFVGAPLADDPADTRMADLLAEPAK
jgi:hypothetical protein